MFFPLLLATLRFTGAAADVAVSPMTLVHRLREQFANGTYSVALSRSEFARRLQDAACQEACPGLQAWLADLDTEYDYYHDLCGHRDTFRCVHEQQASPGNSSTCENFVTPSAEVCWCDTCPGAEVAYGNLQATTHQLEDYAEDELSAADTEKFEKQVCYMIGALGCFKDNPGTCDRSLILNPAGEENVLLSAGQLEYCEQEGYSTDYTKNTDVDSAMELSKMSLLLLGVVAYVPPALVTLL